MTLGNGAWEKAHHLGKPCTAWNEEGVIGTQGVSGPTALSKGSVCLGSHLRHGLGTPIPESQPLSPASNPPSPQSSAQFLKRF